MKNSKRHAQSIIEHRDGLREPSSPIFSTTLSPTTQSLEEVPPSRFTIISKLNRLSEDWEHTAIPSTRRQRLYLVTAVWINFVFVPVFIGFAFNLGTRMDYPVFVASIMLGGIILAVCSAVTGIIGQRTGLSGGLLLRIVFGSVGGRFVALIPPFALIGWDSFSLDLVGSVTASLFGADLRGIAIFIFMVIFAIPAILGFRGLARISLFTTPILVVLLLGALIDASIRGDTQLINSQLPSETFASAITKVVGLFALGATICSPDIQRFCRSARDATLVAIFTFAVALPFLLISAGTAALLVGESTFMGLFTAIEAIGIGYIAFLLLSWSTCDNDYYSASLGLAAVSGLPKSLLVIPIGIVAALLALGGVIGYLETWLVLMTTIAIPLCGVIIAEAVKGTIMSVGQPTSRWRVESLASWILGAGVSYYSSSLQLGIPPIQGILVAFGLQLLWPKLSVAVRRVGDR